MAEILGVAASGMGIASLAIQLGDSVMKLKAFWNAVKEAPEEVKYLIDEIDILRLILSDVGDRESEEDLAQIGPAASQRCLDLCRRGTKLLEAVAWEAEQEIAKKRRIGSIKVVLKRRLIDTLRDRMKSAQFMLMLSNQTYSEDNETHDSGALQKRRHELQWHWAEVHRHELGEIKLAITKTTARSPSIKQIDSFAQISNFEENLESSLDCNKSEVSEDFAYPQQNKFATIDRNQQRLNRSIERHKKLISRLRTPVWLSFSGNVWELCCYRARAGWMFTAQTYRTVPDESPIMEFVEEGNLCGIQELFKKNLASPYDRLRDGTTVLDIAVFYHRLQVCRFLLKEGADPVVSGYGSLAHEVAFSAWFFGPADINLAHHQEIIRCLSSKVDYNPIFDGGEEGYKVPPPAFEYFLNAYETSYKPCTLYERFKAAFEATNRWYNPDLASQIRVSLQGNQFDLSMCLYKSTSGTTLLQWAAEHLGLYHLILNLKEILNFSQHNELPEFISRHHRAYMCKWNKSKQENLLLLIRDLVPAGSDICERNVLLKTPLICVCEGFSQMPFDRLEIESLRAWKALSKRDFESPIRSWLGQLASVGVDLVEYGRRESCLHRRHLVKKEWELKDRKDGSLAVRLISFTYGPLPEDWRLWFTETMDNSFLEFWQMVDHPERAMPGAWVDYEDRSGDDTWDEYSDKEACECGEFAGADEYDSNREYSEDPEDDYSQDEARDMHGETQ